MRWIPALSAAAALALGAGCTRDGPTLPPGQAAAPPAAGPSVASPTVLADFRAAVDDADARLLPALADAGQAARLRSALEELAARLASPDREAARGALVQAQRLLSGQRTTSGDDTADLDAIQLVLDHAATLLGGEATAEPE